MTQEELARYARKTYGTEPERLFPETPETYILRHRHNRKWYAAVMSVPRSKLGLPGEEQVFLLDVKCGPLLMDAYRRLPGILPGYHMNKDNWITILLDGTADDDTIRELFEISFDMTNRTVKPR